MASSTIEQRISSVQQMCAVMFCDYHAMKLLMLSLLLENRNATAILEQFDFLADGFSALALGEQMSDDMIEQVERQLKFYRECLAQLNDLMKQR